VIIKFPKSLTASQTKYPILVYSTLVIPIAETKEKANGKTTRYYYSVLDGIQLIVKDLQRNEVNGKNILTKALAEKTSLFQTTPSSGKHIYWYLIFSLFQRSVRVVVGFQKKANEFDKLL
jgi:hypothetical protein